MTAKKTAPRSVAKQPDPVRQEMTFKASTVRWFIGTLAALFMLYAGWKVVWEDVKTYWRQESIQAQRDKDTAAEFKTMKEKADDDNKRTNLRADTGRAWLFFSLSDFRAGNQMQWAAVCPALKQPAAVCAKWNADALRFQNEADQAKRDAANAGKGP